MRNVRFGDRDSLGLFQQRPSQGWGTAEQILDPEYATNRFYDALVKVDGYADMNIAEAAQEVQRSAAGRGVRPARGAGPRDGIRAVGADPRRGSAAPWRTRRPPVTPRTSWRWSTRTSAVPADELDGSTVTVPVDSEELAWAVGSWAVARAADTGAVRVVVGDREWRRSMQDSAFAWSAAGDESGDARTVTIHLA